MKLNKLVEKIEEKNITGSTDLDITSVEYDSRKVVPGSLFVCIKGFQSDGHAFAGKAVEMGAVALVVEEDGIYPEGITTIKVKDSRIALAYMAAAWFDYAAEKMTVIGLTGTKGKTTTAHMVKKILEEDGYKTGMIGTMGAYIGKEMIPTKNTTPESFELHSLFSQMLQKGCTHVVMEASSQGFKLNRTAGIVFDYGAFLNISPDHIGDGEHKDFEEYLDCKSQMFRQTKQTIINTDADKWEQVTRYATGKPFTVSIAKPADLMATSIQKLWKPGVFGSKFRLKGALNEDMELNIPGDFNVENALIAIAITHLAGVRIPAIRQGLKKVYVKGRTQLLTEASDITTMIIDYAHNALSMEELLKTLRSYKPGRLICLFGGGGNKPKARRYDMGSMAGKYADLTIITTDNPRFEKVEDINADIIVGLDAYHGKYKVILDREEAIHYLIDHARKDDIIALIGKGHEEYQDIEGVKYHFSEQEVVDNYIAKIRQGVS